MSEETIIRTAVVTGGSGALAGAVCIQLAKQGCNVVVNYCHGEAAAAETVALCKAENANGRGCAGRSFPLPRAAKRSLNRR